MILRDLVALNAARVALDRAAGLGVVTRSIIARNAVRDALRAFESSPS